jgi:calcium-dependent protein kinase
LERVFFLNLSVAPWTARSPSELLKNIKTLPLKFGNPNVSNEIKDLLTQCLQIEEDKRIIWDDIYKHPALKGKFDEMLKQTTVKLEDKA